MCVAIGAATWVEASHVQLPPSYSACRMWITEPVRSSPESTQTSEVPEVFETARLRLSSVKVCNEVALGQSVGLVTWYARPVVPS